jgi:nicotinate-nucleotide adenylyltransferase
VRTAIFGGTFNPVHIGHLIIAEEVLAQLDCGEILFVPANIPPHKAVEGPSPELRLEMLERSVAGNPRFRVSDCEIRRSGVSYSIDTVRCLKAAGLVGPDPYLLIGDDLLEGFPSWKEPNALLRECSLVVVHRRSAERLDAPFAHTYLDNELFPVSSTSVRTRIREGGAWRYLVPREAREIIEEHGLYGLERA